MRVSKTVKCAVSGGLSGLVNGLFGGGGGLLLVPLLIRWVGLRERRAFATSVLIVLPLCMVSSVIYLLGTDLSLILALPYVAGGFLGGLAGGRLFRRVPMPWLRRAFALLILYGGIRSLL